MSKITIKLLIIISIIKYKKRIISGYLNKINYYSIIRDFTLIKKNSVNDITNDYGDMKTKLGLFLEKK